ncbi:uncharacterized protein [Mobula birostris]|uniref:uncharacterized protein n=1 Tax=Mobula birostris TaxID=1983395 RepID=UPI003B27DE1E
MTELKSPSDTYKGWLFKWTNYIKGYQRRWFVLSNGLLSYYRSETLGLLHRGAVRGRFAARFDSAHGGGVVRQLKYGVGAALGLAGTGVKRGERGGQARSLVPTAIVGEVWWPARSGCSLRRLLQEVLSGGADSAAFWRLFRCWSLAFLHRAVTWAGLRLPVDIGQRAGRQRGGSWPDSNPGPLASKSQADAAAPLAGLTAAPMPSPDEEAEYACLRAGKAMGSTMPQWFRRKLHGSSSRGPISSGCNRDPPVSRKLVVAGCPMTGQGPGPGRRGPGHAGGLLSPRAGSIHCTFHQSGNHYTWKKVTTTVHNIIVGKLWIDQSGEVDIVNKSTGDKCHLKFAPYSYFSRDVARKVTGVVTDNAGKAHYILSGTWDEKMEYSRVLQSSKGVNGTEGRQKTVYETLRGKELWKRHKIPEHAESMYYFSELALTLNEPEEGVAPTDSRLRPDQRLMENGRWDEANMEKQRLEEQQRAARRRREAESSRSLEEGQSPLESSYRPLWFERREDPYTKEQVHIYKGGYWEAKDRQDWAQCPEIF